MDVSPERSQIDVRDPRAMRALANPLRLTLLGLLRRDGPHSVGELSELADAAPGSVSYHLSTLETFGFVEQAPELARDGRERWWRAAHAMTHYEPSALLADPESAAAGRVMRQAFLQGHLAEQLAYLTPGELRELSDAVNALAEKWDHARHPQRDGTLPVRFIYATFRQP